MTSMEAKPLLVRVAEACNDHQRFHQGRPCNELILKECHTAQLGLQKALPRVEEAYGATANPHPLDVMHLCDLYRNILSGSFCPHAPRFFLQEKDGSNILPRVMCLFEILATKQMQQLAMKQDTQGLEADFVLDKICTTIAHLLNFIPMVQYTVLQGLINFVFDLSVTSEAKLLASHPVVKISVFGGMPGHDYCLNIRNEESLALLQQSTMKSIQTLLTLQQTKHTELSSCLEQTEGMHFDGPFDHVNCPSGLLLSDGEVLTDLLACCRHILLSKKPNNSTLWSLQLDSKISAMILLNNLLMNQGEVTYTSELSLLLASLVSQSATEFLHSLEGGHEPELNTKIHALASSLKEAITKTIITLSPFQMDTVNHEIRLEGIAALIECLPCLSRCPQTGDILELGKAILIAIHVSLLTVSPLSRHLIITKAATSLLTVDGTMSTLLDLLKNCSLAKEAILVLDSLFFSIGPVTSFDQDEIGRACIVALQEASTEKELSHSPIKGQEIASANNSPNHTDMHKYPTKTSLKKPTRKTKPSNPLNFERCQKRFRPDENVATPSPSEYEFSAHHSFSNLSHFTIQPMTISDALAVSLCQALNCAKRIMSVRNPLSMEQSESLCLIVSFITLISSQITRFVDTTEQVWDEQIFCSLYPQVGSVLKLLTNAIERVAHCLTSQFPTFIQDPVVQVTEAMVITDLIFSGALLVHFHVIESKSLLLMETFLGALSQTAWQLWRLNHHDPSYLSDIVAQNQLAKDNNDLRQMHKYTLTHGTCFVKSSYVLAFFYESTILERIGILACLNTTQLSGVSREDTLTKCGACFTELYHNFHDLQVSAQSCILQLTPILVVSMASLLSGTSVCNTLKETSKTLSLDLLPLIPCDLLREMTSSTTEEECRPIFAMYALSRVHTFLLADMPSMPDIKCISQLLYKTHIGTRDSEPRRKKEMSINPNFLGMEMGMDILRMRFPSMEAYDSKTRLRKWTLLAQACRSVDLISLHAVHFDRFDAGDDDSTIPSNDKPKNLLWLVEATFVERDSKLRSYFAMHLGQILLRDDAHLLCALFANRREIDFFLRIEDSHNKSKTEAAVVSRAFHTIDNLMFKFCQIPQSQLSFTFDHTSESMRMSVSNERENATQVNQAMELQHAAIQMLASLCKNVDSESSFQRLVFEYSFVRLIRFWTTADKYERIGDTNVSLASLAFQEIMCISADKELSRLLWRQGRGVYAPMLFVDLLLPCCINLISETVIKSDPIGRELRKRQYDMLSTFIESFFLSSPSEIHNPKDSLIDHETFPDDVITFFNDAIRFVYPSLIVQHDYDTLRLATGFYLFLMHRKMQAEKMPSVGPVDPNDNFTGSQFRQVSKIRGVDASRSILEEQTKLLCLHPDNIGVILPRLLASNFSDRQSSPLLFFLDTVIQRTVQLKEMIQFESSKLLRNILWELSVDDDMEVNAVHAIRSAAAALDQSRTPTVSGIKSNQWLTEVASKWVSANFLSLTVNIVQQKWRSRSMEDRIRALRCLKIMIHFLLPTDAPQFFPQMLATVNMAMSDEMKYDNKATTLRLFAVQAISQYLRLWADNQSEALGQNLATVVVSLFPVIPPSPSVTTQLTPNCEAGRVAISLLVWLSSGTLGKKLAVFFKEIPFLPQSTYLDVVRDSLQSFGVEFNSGLVMTSTQVGSSGLTERDSPTNDEGFTERKSAAGFDSIQSQKSLQRRIHVLCPLFEHESASVRKVTLQYLTSLLRANRCHFHKLIETEELSPSSLFLTEVYDHDGTEMSSKNDMKGRVALMMETLLRRCSAEDDNEAQMSLAICLGEIGAIDENRLGGISLGDHQKQGRTCPGEQSRSWQLTQPPWKSSPTRYELQLVTKHLVGALRAAPDSTDLDRIAFTIQQLLGNLDKDGKRSMETVDNSIRFNIKCDLQSATHNKERGEMSQWLRDQLGNAGVLDMMEPFWASKYKESKSSKSSLDCTPPPFFQHSSSYFMWLSNFCRYMIKRSMVTVRSRWTDFFFACRMAIRTLPGLAVAEFILPLLILDRLCSDMKEDEDAILSEIQYILCHDLPDGKSKPHTSIRMSQGDQQKAAKTIFSILDMLQWWVEHETEDHHKTNARHSSSSSSRHNLLLSESRSNLSASESLSKIEYMFNALPLELRAKAASSVGMHARALQSLEMSARERITQEVFNSPTEGRGEGTGLDTKIRPRKGHIIDGLDRRLLKTAFGNLDDFESMCAVPKGDMEVFSEGSSFEMEARGDFEGAYNAYERCLQLEDSQEERRNLQQGALRCLLELGQFENVINQVHGLLYKPGSKHILNNGDVIADISGIRSSHAIPFAVEAAWKLGRWNVMDDLLSAYHDEEKVSWKSTSYHLLLGKLMLGLQQRSRQIIDTSLASARMVTLSTLSNMSQESYSRSYPLLVRLQCLREIEDAIEVFDDESQSLSEVAFSPSGLDWHGRLDLVSSLKCSTIIDVRAALARICNDSALEGSFHLEKGIKARRNGMYKIAANSLAQATSTIYQANRIVDMKSRGELATFLGSIQLQRAKLQHHIGESEVALRILGDNDVRGWPYKCGSAQTLALALDRDALYMSKLLKSSWHEVADSDRFAKRLLLSTKWMVFGGLKGVSELTERFRVVHNLAPKWEKGHFQFAKYLDTILEARITALTERDVDHIYSDDITLRSFAVFQDQKCQIYIKLVVEQYIEALKLGEKHVYLALPRLLSLWFEFTSILVDEMEKMLDFSLEKLGGNDKSTRTMSVSKVAMSSMQGDINEIMSEATRTIQAKSFYTAMPQLISRVNLRNNETALVVHGILSRVLMKFPGQALWALTWLRYSANKDRARIGDYIFKNAQDSLIKRKQLDRQKMLLASKKLVKFLIDLAKHKPSEPTARHFTIRPWEGEVDLINFIPPVQAALSTAQDQDRIRDMFPRMRAINPQVAVMSSKARPKRVRIFMVPGGQNPQQRKMDHLTDIGELHFLVKNEEKGDLRKDARVQDLNNVINRLLASSKKGAKNRRRLHLRTFAVTCLSEDCGILEWVPHTESFRGLVSKTYNPQAMPTSHRRRGKRLGNFGDPSLRQAFDKCQAIYFKNGDLTRAAVMFEDICLRNYPPLFYWWFVQNFLDPHSWYEARTRFTHSAAAWSAVGHVIGLGDRHSENILIDTSSGACVHVDFDCIFDKGLTLPKPEVIPFRLTSNIVDAFGPIGADGVFTSSLKTAMATLRDNRDTLLSVLEPFLKDPIIDWKKHRSQQKQGKAGTSAKESQDAKQSMQIIDERLRGIYNLRNPNHKKITRTDRVSNSEDDDMMHLLPLSVEGQVDKMISEATSSENLLQCYVGWMPWI